MDLTNKISSLQNRLRAGLHANKIDGLDNAIQIFYACDSDRSNSLNRAKFETFLNKTGLFLPTQELNDLFRFYNKSRSGEVTEAEVISSLQLNLSESRLTAVNRAWQNLDSERRGALPLEQLYKLYNENQHPRVLARERTSELIRQDFQNSIRKYSQNQSISKQGFISYYTSLNSTIPAEQERFFTNLLVGCWNFSSAQSLVPLPRIEQIEEMIYEKIRQRCRGDEDEGRAMLKTFRHFDRDRSGSISLDEFKRCLENWGCVFTEIEIRSLFVKFDADHSGFLDYEEFSGHFAKKGAAGRHQFLPKEEFPAEALNKVKSELLRRGTNGIRGLGIVFRRMDRSRDRNLSHSEFEWGLRENGHMLSPVDVDKLFKFFDRNKDGKVSYDEFLYALRGELNSRRKRLIDLAYQKLDKNGDGQVTLEDMRIAYDVSFHPEFQAGTKTRDQILTEFMSQWDTIKQDGIVSVEEFEEYYKDVSASIDRDDEFELMIRNAWHIAGGEGWCENTTIPRYLETDEKGNQKVVMAKGSETFNYGKSMKRFWGGDI